MPHGRIFHGIHEPIPVDKAAVPLPPRIIKPRQQLWRHRQIRVQNRQQITGRFRKANTHRIVLSSSQLLIRREFPAVSINFDESLNLFPCAVRRVPFDENNFHIRSGKRWHPLQRGFQIASFISSRNDDRQRWCCLRQLHSSDNDQPRHGKSIDQRNGRQHCIQNPTDQRDPEW